MEESFDVYVPNPDNVVTESDARLSTDKTEYKSGENVTVHFRVPMRRTGSVFITKPKVREPFRQ